MRVLIVEDNAELARQVKSTLEHEMYVVDIASDGEEGLFMGENEPYDAIILDLGLPKLDGLSILQKWRSAGCEVPVLILTSRDTWREKVAGLRAGADDYLAKPFEMSELLARLNALQRRVSTATTSEISIGPVLLDISTHKVSVDGRNIDLPRREYMLLKALMENPGRVLSRESLETRLYSWNEEVSSNSIEVHIHHLRKKIAPDFIRTIRGVGYTVNKA